MTVTAFVLVVLAILAVLLLTAGLSAAEPPTPRQMGVLIVLLCILAALGLTGCATRAPNVPKQVTVVVEKFKPLPAWATDPLAKPEPADGTVGARLHSHEARGAVIDVANCHRLLLKKLDAGEAVDPKECAQP